MKLNPILEEIRRIRDEQAREVGHDVHRLFTTLRSETDQFKKQGRTVNVAKAQPTSDTSIVNEDSP